MVLTDSLFDASPINKFELGLRLTMLQIYLCQYLTVAETQKKVISAPLPCTVYMCTV